MVRAWISIVVLASSPAWAQPIQVEEGQTVELQWTNSCRNVCDQPSGEAGFRILLNGTALATVPPSGTAYAHRFVPAVGQYTVSIETYNRANATAGAPTTFAVVVPPPPDPGPPDPSSAPVVVVVTATPPPPPPGGIGVDVVTGGSVVSTHATIQAAVNALPADPSGSLVRVHPGTYREMVVLPCGRRHITIQAAFAYRQPLTPARQWAAASSQRAVLEASGRDYGIVSCSPDEVQNWAGENDDLTIDGLLIQGARLNGVYLNRDDRARFLNGGCLNNGLGGGENQGCLEVASNDVSDPASDSLVLNWYCGITQPDPGPGDQYPSCYQFEGMRWRLLMSECHLLDTQGECLYGHGNNQSDGWEVAYNSFHGGSGAVHPTRIRRSIGGWFHHNVLWFDGDCYASHWEENVDGGTVENHVIERNTWRCGNPRRPHLLGFRFQNGTIVRGNVVHVTTQAPGSYMVGYTYDPGSTTNHSLTVTGNRYSPTLGGLAHPQTPMSSVTASGNSTQASTFDGRGCLTNGDNGVLGANLDISQVPYRTCAGDPIPVT